MNLPLRILARAAVLVAALACAVPAFADDVSIDVISGTVTKIPVRVLALTPSGGNDAGTATQARDVLANDLETSGALSIVRAWEPMSADAAVQLEVGGTWSVNGAQVTLAGEVHDWPGRKPVLAKTYRGPLSGWRSLVHQFADDVVGQLTGEPGVANTRIAFVVSEGRNKELWVMDADGANAHALTHDASIAQLPAWSPDGSLLLFTSFRGGSGAQVWVVSPDGGKPYLVSGRPGINSGGVYSPDGGSIACTLTQDGNSEIYRMDARGGSPQRLTANRAIDTSPSWSPTGNAIAFTSDRAGSPQVHVMDAQGGNVRRLNYALDYTDSPAWSPKGDRIAFVTRTGSGFDICVCRPDGTGTLRVVTGGANENPHWSPDGRHLVFTSDREGSRSLWVSDLDGGAPRKLDTGGRKALSPAWSPRSVPAAPR